MIQSILLVLLILILLDLHRLHRKVDKLLNIHNPILPLSNEEIEQMLERENNNSEE